MSRKPFFPSKTSTNTISRSVYNKNKGQISIFQLKPWVNPFGKIIYMAALYIGHFHSPESLSFHLKHQQTLFLCIFRTKRNQVQISIFQLKPWVNPFGKITNNGDSGNWTFSWSRTPFFPSKTSANTIFGSI